jgi:hypothetical protein
MNENIEFFFELPESLKIFGLSPGETTRKEVDEIIIREKFMILTDEQPSPTVDNLYNPAATEMVLGSLALKELYGFPLKGLILNFHKGLLDKLFCIFKHGDEPEIDFMNIFKKLEGDIFGQPHVIHTPGEVNEATSDWHISWSYRFFSISLILNRETSDLMLIFSDKLIQKILAKEESRIFADYVNRQMKGENKI